jgi:large subunit ribosomal protein L25
MLKLTVEKREKGSAAATRTAGKIPGVFYGPKAESTPVSIKEVEFMKAWRSAGESSVITLNDGAEDHDALIHDVMTNPVTDKVEHVDFYVIEKGKKVSVAIPLEFVGESAAVKNMDGILIKVIHELEIEAMPKDLPHAVEVDISSLVDFNSQIKVSDIKLPAGVEAKIDADEVVALVSAPKEEVEEEAVTTIDMDAIGISEKKGKKDEEGAEGAPEAAAE